MVEIAQRLHRLDADVGLRIAQQLPEGGERTLISDAAESFDRRPADVRIGERGDERLDAERILQGLRLHTDGREQEASIP
jgi:hypothetical protein